LKFLANKVVFLVLSVKKQIYYFWPTPGKILEKSPAPPLEKSFRRPWMQRKNCSHRKKSAFHHTLLFMTKQRSQFGCGYLQTEQEVTESLILNSNHSRPSFAAANPVVSFSRHLCSRRDARVDKLMPKNDYVQNSNIFALNKTVNIYIE